MRGGIVDNQDASAAERSARFGLRDRWRVLGS
jgi:hypothetical protein